MEYLGRPVTGPRQGFSYSKYFLRMIIALFSIKLSFCIHSHPLIDTLILDIDECSDAYGGCHANADCQNTVGSFVCSCKAGYSGNGLNCHGKLLLLKKVEAEAKKQKIINKSHA